MLKMLKIITPDDWHLHLRDNEKLKSLMKVPLFCKRAIIMPNLKPPVTTTERALAYRSRILKALPSGSNFQPLMTLYLTDNTPPEEIEKAHKSGQIYAVKLYPAGATTNSSSGVTDIEKVYPTLKMMEKCGMPLLVHSEVTTPTVDIFDREAVFIEKHLKPLLKTMPTLKIVLEHITTSDSVDFVMSSPDNVAATITAHHLLYNRNELFKGGIRPHMYCLPVLKREKHRLALLRAIQSGSKKFFLGTDSAPHTTNAKESECGCAGVFTTPIALQLYAEAFDSVDSLHLLEAFASKNGPSFYGLPENTETTTLVREDTKVVDAFEFADGVVRPLRAGENIHWKIV